MDDPGPNTPFLKSPLPYGDGHEDLPPSPCAIQEALLFVNAAADQRALEAKSLFGPIAGIFDQYCESNPNMSDKQQRAFKSFYDDLVKLASKNFDAYIRGTKVSPMSHKTSNEPPPPTDSRPDKKTMQAF
ncbi:hypothetical protein EV44_g4114 [Erysiphe necator]|uniref:Uncharacterized protein n=1 Tax=Uncinula necator TaxID=52586 RepID=A0A0B1P4F7_UNCNE|nr:hypothetical protein EV44_g4114 [Erysiphe necator]